MGAHRTSTCQIAVHGDGCAASAGLSARICFDAKDRW